MPSPCIDVCIMSAPLGVDGMSLCTGCGRTLHEIAAWSALDDDSKRAVWRALPERKQRLAALTPGPKP